MGDKTWLSYHVGLIVNTHTVCTACTLTVLCCITYVREFKQEQCAVSSTPKQISNKLFIANVYLLKTSWKARCSTVALNQQLQNGTRSCYRSTWWHKSPNRQKETYDDFRQMTVSVPVSRSHANCQAARGTSYSLVQTLLQRHRQTTLWCQ